MLILTQNHELENKNILFFLIFQRRGIFIIQNAKHILKLEQITNFSIYNRKRDCYNKIMEDVMDIDKILEETEIKMQHSIEAMEKKFMNVRAGRANPAILNKVEVLYYGVPTPLNQLAQISIPEARQLAIKPFDKSCLGAIEKGIYEANIGLTPNNNGETIILNIPALTEETRREYVKQVREIAEEGRIALRNIRQDANNEIKRLDITEDDIKGGQSDVQDLISKYNKIIEAKLKEKEQELMSV